MPFLLVCCYLLRAQSSDNPKYFILYDVSGSTSYIDKHGHLEKLLLKTIGQDPYNMENSSSFEIIFFGTKTSAPTKIAFNLPSLANPHLYTTKQKNVLDTIRRLTGPEKRHNQFSHIHAALAELDRRINEVAGVFIFTDGRLLPGDISPALNLAVGDYSAYVAETLKEIQHSGVPVFLIQTSAKRESPYFRFPTGNAVSGRHSLFGEEFFWMYNENNRDSASVAFARFNRFLAHAQNKMMTRQSTFIVSPKDTIAALVALHQIQVLTRATGTDLESKDLVSSVDAATRSQIAKLSGLLSKSSLKLEEAQVAKGLMESLIPKEAALSQVLFDLREQASAARQLTESVYAKTAFEENTAGETEIDVATTSLLSRDIEKELIMGLTRYLIKRTQQEALFFLFENLDTKMTIMSPYIKDTLFQNTYNFITRYKKHQDLLLVKEALHRDIDELHDNLILHPKVRESEALVALGVVHKAVSAIQSAKTLEGTFEEIQRLTDRWAKAGPSKTRAEKAIVLMTRIVEFLKRFNLTTRYQDLTPEQLTFIAREIVLFYGTTGDFEVVRLDRIEEHVSNLYKQFHQTRARIKDLQTSFQSTEQDYAEWLELRRNILLNVLKEVSNLIITSIDLSSEFHKTGESANDVRLKVAQAKDQAENMIESWFLVRDGKYVESVVSLLPVITSVIHANPNLQKYMSGDLAVHAESLNARKKLLNKQLAQWDVKGLKDLEARYTAAKASIAIWNTESLTLEEFKAKLAKVNLPELELLIVQDKIPVSVQKALEDFIKDAAESDGLQKVRNMKFDYPLASAFALRYLEFTELNEKIENLISIAAEVSTAVEADDITNVLLKYSLPPASYRAKHEVKSTLMINAYTGIGTNFTKDRPLNISAPLGLELSLRSKNRQTSFSFFATPIDLGNVINYELLGNEDATDDEVFRWQNIYSPGGFFVLGLSRNHPFSLGFGYQANPKRASVFIAFDLPVFRIR